MSRPRIRTLKPEAWADERVGLVSRDARLLWLVLLTAADDEGRLRALPAAILGHGYPYGDATGEEVERWLVELAQMGLLDLYEHQGVRYAAHPRWRSHQRIDRPTRSSLPAPPGASDAEQSAAGSPRRTFGEDSTKPRGALAESSTLDQDQDQDQDRSISSSPPVPGDDPEIARLCHLLAELVRQRDEKAKVAPDSKRWLDDMRRLLADRAGDHGEVERVLRWSQDDSFWSPNVLSPGKLRGKFSQLLLASARPGSAARQNGHDDAYQATRRRRAAALRSLTSLGHDESHSATVTATVIEETP